MYTINSYRNNLIISPFLWLLLHYKHLWWSNVRWEFVLLSLYLYMTVLLRCCFLIGSSSSSTDISEDKGLAAGENRRSVGLADRFMSTRAAVHSLTSSPERIAADRSSPDLANLNVFFTWICSMYILRIFYKCENNVSTVNQWARNRFINN